MAEMIEWEERAAMADARPETVMPVAGKPALLLGAYDLAPLGYQAEEFFLSGSATRYTLAGPPTSDGVWSVTPAASAAYKTRVVVIRQSDPARIYATMKQLGPEIEFQTWRTTPKDFDGTIRLGVSYGASSIELYQDYGGFPLVPDARLRQWAAMLEKNSGEPAR
jgi:hypothetical protein